MNMSFQPPNMTIKEVSTYDGAALRRIRDFLNGQAQATPFHYPEWMLAIVQACDHAWTYLLAENNAGAIMGLLPLHKVRSPLFGSALVSSGFAVGGGIIALNDASKMALIKAVIHLSERDSLPSIELRGGVLPKGEGWTHNLDLYSDYIGDLAEDDEAQLLAIPRKQRAEIRKGLRNDLEIVVADDDAAAAEHYAIYAESVHNLGTPVFPKALFDAVRRNFAGHCDILTVRKDGKPLASVLSLYYRDIVMPYWGGGTLAARHYRANDMMYYALMNHARVKGMARFDFGRSKCGTGAAAFKKNWGFTGNRLNYAYYKADGAPVRSVNPLDAQYQNKVKIWRRLPLAMTKFIGPYIARELA